MPRIGIIGVCTDVATGETGANDVPAVADPAQPLAKIVGRLKSTIAKVTFRMPRITTKLPFTTAGATTVGRARISYGSAGRGGMGGHPTRRNGG